jgi:hypothetical protein
MSELCRVLEHSVSNKGIQFHVYADDVLIFIECAKDNLLKAVETLQETLTIIEKWAKSNSLLLNVDKTDLVLIHRKKSLSSPPNVSLNVCGLDLKLRTSGDLRWLGVCFDVNLEMASFVSNTCNTCFGLLRMLRRVRGSIDKKSVVLLCNALVLSRVDYCNSLLSTVVNASHLLKLKRVINLAARVATGTRRYDHISPALTQLGWLPIEQRASKKIAILVFKALNGVAPQYLSEAVVRYVPNRPLRSCDSNVVQLVLGRANSKIGRGSWSVLAPIIWNSLPADVRLEGLRFSGFLCKLNKYFLSLSSALS